MYLEHYQLKLMPFEISPNPQFLWLGGKHQEAFAILKYGILENKGFIVLIGEPGTGKSTLLNAIIDNFGPNIRFAKIADPALSEMDFFNFAANAFEMGRTFDSKADFLIQLQKFIFDKASRSEKVVLVIDEAQRLAPGMMEQIRILSNFEKPDQKAISCIFAGQNEFLNMVKGNPAMSQRVFFSHIIQPLSETETGDYIAHRLKVAGAAGQIFSSGAVREVFRLSGGNPRLINITCDQALLSGFAANLKTIGPDLISKCIEDTLISHAAPPEPLTAHGSGASRAQPGRKEDAADVTADQGERVAAAAPEAFKRKGPYWALAAALVLIIAGYAYFSGELRTILSKDKDLAAAVQKNNELEAVRKENTRLQAQLVEVTHQKSAAEARLGEAQKQNTALAVDAKDQEIARNRVGQLEAGLSERDNQLIRLEQKFGELERALAKEKSAKDQVSGELSSRQAEIADLQKRLETARSAQLKLETDIQNTQKENTQLRSQLQELKGLKSAPLTVPTGTSSMEPDPTGVIDFVIKKKSQ